MGLFWVEEQRSEVADRDSHAQKEGWDCRYHHRFKEKPKKAN